MKNSANQKFKLLYFTCIIMFIFSCSEDIQKTNEITFEENEFYEKPDPNDPVVKTLVGRGWNIDKINKMSNGDYAIGDIVFSGDIKDYTTSKQVRFKNLVKNYKNL